MESPFVDPGEPMIRTSRARRPRLVTVAVVALVAATTLAGCSADGTSDARRNPWRL